MAVLLQSNDSTGINVTKQGVLKTTTPMIPLFFTTSSNYVFGDQFDRGTPSGQSPYCVFKWLLVLLPQPIKQLNWKRSLDFEKTYFMRYCFFLRLIMHICIYNSLCLYELDLQRFPITWELLVFYQTQRTGWFHHLCHLMDHNFGREESTIIVVPPWKESFMFCYASTTQTTSSHCYCRHPSHLPGHKQTEDVAILHYDHSYLLLVQLVGTAKKYSFNLSLTEHTNLS